MQCSVGGVKDLLQYIARHSLDETPRRFWLPTKSHSLWGILLVLEL